MMANKTKEYKPRINVRLISKSGYKRPGNL